MTELMKRYEAETGKSSTQTITDGLDMWHYEYIEWLEAQVLDGETIEKFQKIIRTQCDEISALKAQLTWRPVSEKPEENDEDYFILSASGDVQKMRYHDGAFFIFDDEVSAYFLPTQHPLKKPKYWLPIPPAPEGEAE